MRFIEVDASPASCSLHPQGDCELELVLSGTLSEYDLPRVQAMVAHLRKLLRNSDLTLVEVKRGSVKLVLSGSAETLQELADLVNSGKLTEVLGAEILAVSPVRARSNAPVVHAGVPGQPEEEAPPSSGQPDKEQTFEALFEKNRSRIYNLCYSLLGDRELAEDAAQETFLRAYRLFPTFRGDSLFSTWIYAVATNVAIHLLRKRKSELSRSLDLPISPEEPGRADIPDPASVPQVSTSLLAVLETALEQLAPSEREVIRLYYFQELSPQEIAGHLGIPTRTVLRRLYRAREELRKAMEQDETG